MNGAITYSYDPAGNVTTRTDARAVATTYAYDALRRVTIKSYSDGTPTVTYCYDGTTAGSCSSAPGDTSGNHAMNLKGRLSLMSSGVGSMAYGAYDELGRVTASTQTFPSEGSYGFSYTWNFLSLKSVTYPTQRQVTHGFDGAGRVNSVSGLMSGQSTSYVNSIAYAPHGAIQQIAYGPGQYEQTCYNNRLQVEAILLRTAAPTGNCGDTTNNWWKLGLSYGAANNGNLSGETISDGDAWNVTQSFTYDKPVSTLRTAYSHSAPESRSCPKAPACSPNGPSAENTSSCQRRRSCRCARRVLHRQGPKISAEIRTL
ncbi:MAG TPA: hypothetical protein VNH18_10535 [Bryobacteraceae bacterium]|nr:hypothetical protein [Bryobacteraceae bacterium]